MTRPVPLSQATLAAELCEVCRIFGERQWCLATSGNFSVRVDDSHCIITQSGKDKGQLKPADLMVCDLDGRPRDPEFLPSAETALHVYLYRRDPGIGAVLHTHSIASTLVSASAADSVTVSGYEMQKALPGIRSHEDTVTVPVFDNRQDMAELVEALQRHFEHTVPVIPGFLVRAHGLYAWGPDLPSARRHIEGLEFLLTCLWQQRLAGSG